MDIINKRYKIIKKLKTPISGIKNFLVEDLWNDEKILDLKVLAFSSLSFGNLIKVLEEDFITIKNINSSFFVKNYGFANLFWSSSPDIIFDSDEKAYICTTAHIEKQTPLEKFIQNCKMKDILDVVIFVCRALTHINNLGFSYNILTLDNIFIVNGNRKNKFRLKDIISTKLENQFAITKIQNTSKKHNSDNAQLIAKLVISMLAKKQITSKYVSELNKIKNKYNLIPLPDKERKIFECLWDFAQKTVKYGKNKNTPETYDIIYEINNILSTDYAVDPIDPLESITFHTKLIGRSKYVNKILDTRQEIAIGKAQKNVFLISGSEGLGKTRLLKEIEYKLSFEKTGIYSNYELKNKKNINVSIDFINKTLGNIKETLDVKQVNKIIQEIKRINSKNNNKKNNTDKFKFFYQITKFIFSKNHQTPAFILIDDFNLVDDNTLDAILYAVSEVAQNEKLGIVLSYNQAANAKSKKFDSVLKTLINSENVEICDLNNLSREETIQFVQSILLVNNKEKKLARSIYKQTSGHPKFITDFIKELVEKKLLYKNKDDGSWIVSEEYYKKISQDLILPETKKNIEQQIKTISVDEEKLLSIMSLFNESFPIEYVSKLLTLPKAKILSISEHFIKIGIIYKIHKSDKTEYIISDKKLKEMIYQKIPIEEREKKHRKISQLLEKEKNNSNLDELIWHLENSGRTEYAIKFCDENAKKYLKEQEFNKAIKYYKKSELLIPKNKIRKRCKVLLNIFELYHKRGLKNEANEALNKVTELIHKVDDTLILSEYYYVMAKQAHFSDNVKDQLLYIKKQKDLYKRHKQKIIHLRLLHVTSLYHQMYQRYDKLEKLAQNMVKISGDATEYSYFKLAAFVFLGYIYFYRKMYDEAVKVFEEAKKIAIENKNTQVELVSSYNISIISLTIFGNEEESINFIKEILHKTAKDDFISIGISAIMNYAWFLAKSQKNIRAYKYAKKAKIESEKNNLVTHKFESIALLIQISKNLNQYKQMIKYKKCFAHILKNSNFEEKLFYKYTTYSILSEAYESLDDYNKAYYYINKALQFKKHKRESVLNLLYFRKEAIKISQREKNSINYLCEIFDKYAAETYQDSNKLKKNVIHRELMESVIHLQLKRMDLDLKKLILKILEYKKYCKYNFQKACIYYLESCIYKENELELLKQALDIAKHTKIYDFLILLYTKIAFHYMHKQKENLAILNFLEAERLVLKRLNNTPTVYRRVNFANSLNFIPFDVIEKFLNKKDISKYKIHNKKISKEKFESLLNANHKITLNKNKEFKKKLIQEMLIDESYQDYTKTEICRKIGNSYKDNIFTIMKFISINILANNFEIFISKNNNEITPLFNQKAQSKEMKLIHKWIKQHTYEKLKTLDDYFDERSLVIPLKNDTGGSIINGIQGVMVFTSDYVINNFSYDSIEFCKSYMNFITSFLKSNSYKRTTIYDELTGSLTRKYFEILLKTTYTEAKEEKSEFSLILYDIDHFKSINDTYGHHTGDIVLKTITKEILDEMQSGYMLGRYGGEEFCMILPNTDKETALAIAEEMRKKIEALEFLEGKFKITISLGVSTYTDFEDNVNKLLLKADQALYHAKNTGRNKSCAWTFKHLSTNRNSSINTNSFINNESKFSENLLFLTDLMKIYENEREQTTAMNKALRKIFNFFAADDAAIISISKKNKFKIISKIGFETYKINDDLLNSVISTGTGISQIDWDHIVQKNIVANIPEWNSIMIAPLIKKEKIVGFIYLSIAEKKHEFNNQNLNTLELFADIITANL